MKGPFRLLVLYGLVTLGTSQVDVDQFVNVNRGQEVTLRCVYTGTHTPGSITWRKVNGDASVRIAVALSSGYRIDNSTFYGRLNFTNYTSELWNGSIRIEDLRLGDEGDFSCIFATLDDDVQATINLTVNVPPKASLELNPNNLVDGMGLVTVVTCVAQEGKPAASITWSGLHQGSSNETTEVAPNGTVMVRSRYWLEPTYESHGRILTCRVEHRALDSPVEYSTTLNIHYKPRVSIAGYDGNWYVDKEGASLTCEADGNPNSTHYLWDRKNGSLPNGTVVSGNSLSFKRPLVESDSGSFYCWANNSVGWGEAVVIITIRSGGGAGVEPWIIAVAVIVPLLVLAAVAALVFLFCKKKGTQAMKKRKHGQDAPVGSAHQLNDHTNNDVETPGAQPHGKGAPIGQQIPSENKTTEYAEITMPPPGKDNLTDGGLNGKPNRGYEDNPAGSGGKQSPQAAPVTIYAELDKENLAKKSQFGSTSAGKPTSSGKQPPQAAPAPIYSQVNKEKSAKKSQFGSTSADKPTSSSLQAEDDDANGQQGASQLIGLPKPNVPPKPRKDSQNNNY
ncbi:nectin-3-like isoform X2 [Lethenteron reissneri]|uniref:nectin-3-like isoform X2 n=1 Tax=Lethenteron reissneri TaxID=7753 RepID=UPI002AB6D4C9|nr:nectin-3-like isoform X2 [Lethenteron reissneri]